MTRTLIRNAALAAMLTALASAAPAAAQEPATATYLMSPKKLEAGGGSYLDGVSRSVRVTASTTEPGTKGNVCARITIGDDYVEEGCGPGLVKIADHPNFAKVQATIPSTYRKGGRRPRSGIMQVGGIASATAYVSVVVCDGSPFPFTSCYPRVGPGGPYGSLMEGQGSGDFYASSTGAGSVGGTGDAFMSVGWPHQ